MKIGYLHVLHSSSIQQLLLLQSNDVEIEELRVNHTEDGMSAMEGDGAKLTLIVDEVISNDVGVIFNDIDIVSPMKLFLSIFAALK